MAQGLVKPGAHDEDRHISIVDMDHIVRSNLSRCVLFTEMDAGERRLKAEVAVERLTSMEPGIDVRAYTSKIQEMGEVFIRKHDLVLAVWTTSRQGCI